jgi:putative oxygen-independent coproporphyrinogen III oxidase
MSADTGRHNRVSDPVKIPGGFGLYVHWPFCVSKCPYCDFNSHVSDAVDHKAWQSGLLAELDHFGNKTKGRRLDTVFFGGGTPSLMPPDTVAAILEALPRYWDVAPDIEITLEANPSSVEARKFADFRAAGVNRVSVGVQSFDNEALRFLGRAHSADAAANAITIAKQTFDRTSFDLIYALPGQNPEDWARQLDRALGFSPEHLSLYQLTIEKGTTFYSDHRNGAFDLPDEELAADLYELTGESVLKAGLHAYEVSNYAVIGQESRHNLIYWRGGDYAGIGPGAHGRLTIDGQRYRSEQVPLPANWLGSIGQRGHATKVFVIITGPEQIIEYLLMGMRLSEGIDRRLFARRTGRKLEDCLDGARTKVLQEAGLIELDAAGLRATASGRLRLNALTEALVSEFV